MLSVLNMEAENAAKRGIIFKFDMMDKVKKNYIVSRICNFASTLKVKYHVHTLTTTTTTTKNRTITILCILIFTILKIVLDDSNLHHSFPETVISLSISSFLGHAVAQLVEALRCKPAGRGFDSRWSHWNF